MSAESFAVPATMEEVTPDWLRAALADTLHLPHFEWVASETIGVQYGMASRIFRCRLEEGNAPVSVVVKLWDTSGPGGMREVNFYRDFGGRVGAPVPACYHAAADPVSGRGVLVVEDVGQVVQGDCLHRLSRSRAEALVEALAALHATWWERAEIHGSPWLPSVSRSERDVDWIASRRGLFLERFGDRLDGVSRRLLDQLELVHLRADERLASAGTTLLHGDLHLDNVVFEGGTDRPILLDWARSAKGPAALDLAELLFAIAWPADRDALLAAYVGRMRDRSVAGVDDRSLRCELGGALLRMFSTRTCGVARWQPANERETQMIELGLERTLEAIAAWREVDPSLLRF